MAMYLALFSKGIVATISACITLFSTIMAKVNSNFRVSYERVLKICYKIEVNLKLWLVDHCVNAINDKRRKSFSVKWHDNTSILPVCSTVGTLRLRLYVVRGKLISKNYVFFGSLIRTAPDRTAQALQIHKLFFDWLYQNTHQKLMPNLVLLGFLYLLATNLKICAIRRRRYSYRHWSPSAFKCSSLPQILNATNPNDSFIKCMYFYVITLTTVGLGDISMTEAQPFVLIRVLFVFCVGTSLPVYILCGKYLWFYQSSWYWTPFLMKVGNFCSSVSWKSCYKCLGISCHLRSDVSDICFQRPAISVFCSHEVTIDERWDWDIIGKLLLRYYYWDIMGYHWCMLYAIFNSDWSILIFDEKIKFKIY